MEQGKLSPRLGKIEIRISALGLGRSFFCGLWTWE